MVTWWLWCHKPHQIRSWKVPHSRGMRNFPRALSSGMLGLIVDIVIIVTNGRWVEWRGFDGNNNVVAVLPCHRHCCCCPQTGEGEPIRWALGDDVVFMLPYTPYVVVIIHEWAKQFVRTDKASMTTMTTVLWPCCHVLSVSLRVPVNSERKRRGV